MMTHIRMVGFVGLLLLLVVTGALAQDEGSLFTVADDEPIIIRGDAQYTDPGGVIFHDGVFQMFHNRFDGWPAAVDIFQSTSTDGVTWTLASEEPVFSGADVEYAGVALLASSILVEDDGTWVMYFYTWETNAGLAPTSIGRATAPEPSGPWVADDEPILVAGSDGEWDELQVVAPTVVKTNDGYVMYYTGATSSALSIGMATSEDGINWTKYDDPSTTDAPYAESDPIIVELGNPNYDDDEQYVWQPQVVVTDDGWVMLYKHGDKFYAGPTGEIAYAISQDGITWEQVHDVIAIDYTDIDRGRAIWFTELVYAEGTYYLYFELGNGSNTDIYVATYDGNLFE